ncbi:hypothetical protein SAMN05444673_7014 [Bacillus sp. OV166]|uniref:CBO0543 family protein n=1 Tax=Bacillus sp. OV166 TaxID=1882763 RepID=UPI000A2AAADB|nr:CBO0543 family protein [Bacillus sp. OV166]SMQ86932.1 hypothetical protein SAMN05444673_7014 [Bacillus sp. OV166]
MKSKLDKAIEISAWIITSLLLIKFVPRKRIREAIFPFLFKQLITWLFGLIVVEKNLISYPKRLFFKKSNKSSFTFEYFVYPALSSLFILYFPENKSNIVKTLYYCFHTSILTIFELFAVKYTNLIRYKKWTGYWSFITMWICYYLERIFQRWFFKIDTLEKKG